ncbi:MAG TPA: AbrB family transcriptional regulator [archaeon]|nr:AbrB family transcriptional regulator [archaeon]
MPILITDERRRIILPRHAVEKYGHKFIAIETDKGILLKALPKDPVKALAMEGKKLPKGTTLEKMKKETEEEILRYL